MAERGPDRQIPLRARSSSGLAAGALTYNHGLEAHILVERPRRGRPWSRSFLSRLFVADTSAVASPCTRNLQPTTPPGQRQPRGQRNPHQHHHARYDRGMSENEPPSILVLTVEVVRPTILAAVRLAP